MTALRFLLGKPADWHLHRRTRSSVIVPRPSGRWIGPLLVAITSVLSWPAFANAQGPGQVALGLWIGSVAIMLMAWSFVLALRLKWLERPFGGLDSMYRIHRWAGTLSIGAMWLHTSIEPEIRGGIRGAARGVAESAEDLAETGQTMLYALVGLSLLRFIPYRWWRWTHKLIGLPFAFASWHFFTAEKTYANASAWGWWFGAWMIAGLAAWLLRVVGMDMVRRGRLYKVVAADHVGTTTRLELEPLGRPLNQNAGQFAFVKLDSAGMREPHPFTISSSPQHRNLEFMIRHLGDWSDRLPETDLVGSTVRIEGPHGRFEPWSQDAAQVGPIWVAGGVGATPFLAAVESAPAGAGIPTMLYAVREVEDNLMLERLRAAEQAGRLRLELFTPDTGRMSPEDLDRLFPNGVAGRHVALCGPAGLVGTMAAGARARGARSIETEDFDLRQGFGPDRSREIDRAVRGFGASTRKPVAEGSSLGL